jgi:hypothetical protein
MKKILVLITVLVLLCSLAIAVGEGQGQGADQDTPKPELMQGLEDVETPKPQLINVNSQSGIHISEKGQEMRIQMQENQQCKLEVEGISADCPANMVQEKVQEKTKLHVALSNGKNAQIKVMPNTASETALARLRLKNCNEECTIELKEVGTGEQVRMAYELKSQRNSKVFGMFNAKMDVEAQVDAETGELIKSNKPWWAFLASEKEE